MNPTYTYTLTVQKAHLDTMGHVNNAIFLSLFEEARWAIINEKGYGIDKIQATRLGPIVLEAHLRFVKELTLDMLVTIKTEFLEYSGKVGNIKQWMENEAGHICCEAHFKVGLFDLDNRKLVHPTAEWLYALSLQKD